MADGGDGHGPGETLPAQLEREYLLAALDESLDDFPVAAQVVPQILHLLHQLLALLEREVAPAEGRRQLLVLPAKFSEAQNVKHFRQKF